MAIDYMPQINPKAVGFLKSIIRPDWKVFEWGSGQSTVFFARRVAEMVSVEHHPDWMGQIGDLLSADDLEIAYLYRAAIPDMGERNANDPLNYRYGEGDTTDWKDYVTAIDTYPNLYFDLVFVDGGARLSCMWHAIPKVALGGYILLDDSERPRNWKPIVTHLCGWQKREFMSRKGGHLHPLSKATFWRRPCSF